MLKPRHITNIGSVLNSVTILMKAQFLVVLGTLEKRVDVSYFFIKLTSAENFFFNITNIAHCDTF